MTGNHLSRPRAAHMIATRYQDKTVWRFYCLFLLSESSWHVSLYFYAYNVHRAPTNRAPIASLTFERVSSFIPLHIARLLTMFISKDRPHRHSEYIALMKCINFYGCVAKPNSTAVVIVNPENDWICHNTTLGEHVAWHIIYHSSNKNMMPDDIYTYIYI